MLIGIFRSGISVTALKRALRRVDQAQALVDGYAGRVRERINQAIADRAAVVNSLNQEIVDLGKLA